ncbi:MAG: signal peptidase I, partial [Ardenticatenaceae bacterium]
TVECRPNEILVNGQVIAEPYGPNEGSYYCPPTTLGPEEYYVLGDNRNQSSDSHSWGPLERQYIIGKAWFLYWPLDDMGWVPNFRIRAPGPGGNIGSFDPRF